MSFRNAEYLEIISEDFGLSLFAKSWVVFYCVGLVDHETRRRMEVFFAAPWDGLCADQWFPLRSLSAEEKKKWRAFFALWSEMTLNAKSFSVTHSPSSGFGICARFSNQFSRVNSDSLSRDLKGFADPISKEIVERLAKLGWKSCMTDGGKYYFLYGPLSLVNEETVSPFSYGALNDDGSMQKHVIEIENRMGRVYVSHVFTFHSKDRVEQHLYPDDEEDEREWHYGVSMNTVDGKALVFTFGHEIFINYRMNRDASQSDHF